MDTDLTTRETRYFWNGWFEGHSLTLLFATYGLLSLADLIASLRLMLAGIIREGNALADYMWEQHGVQGFIVYKAALVAFIVVVITLVHQRNGKLARAVLYGGILVMSAVALRHLAIISAVVALQYWIIWGAVYAPSPYSYSCSYSYSYSCSYLLLNRRSRPIVFER